MENNPRRRYEPSPEKVEYHNHNVSYHKILISFLKIFRYFAKKIKIIIVQIQIKKTIKIIYLHLKNQFKEYHKKVFHKIIKIIYNIIKKI